MYAHYDLVIWSATSMKWIEVKMRELGVSTHAGYKVALFLDHQSMVTVRDEKHGACLSCCGAFVDQEMSGVLS